MIISNEVNVSAKYFINPISPEGTDYFPSIEGFISCRQATLERPRCVGFSIRHDILSGFLIRQLFHCKGLNDAVLMMVKADFKS